MKLSSRMKDRIVMAVEDSILPLNRIAENSGIAYSTLRNWIRNGKETKQKIDDEEIKLSDLSVKKLRELEIFLRLKIARPKPISYTMERIHEIDEKEKDIEYYIRRLSMLHPVYRDD